jgi:hypothetical protein
MLSSWVGLTLYVRSARVCRAHIYLFNSLGISLKTLLIAIIMLAFVAVSCGKNETPTSAQNPSPTAFNKSTSVWEPIQDGLQLWNECCGEYVTYSGRVHYTTTEKAGILTLHINTANLVGIGEDGARYQAAENDQIAVLGSGCPLSVEGDWRFRVTSTANGHDCSYVLKIHYKYSFDADCNLTIDENTYSIECA